MNRSRLGWLLAALALLGAGAWGLSAPSLPPGQASARADTLLARLAAEPGQSVAAGHLYPHHAWLQLLDPSARLPRSFDVDYVALSALHAYARSCDAADRPAPAPGLHKLFAFEAARCGHAPLSKTFFDRPPWLHPGGGSFVWRARELDAAYASPDFYAANLGGMHVLELADPALQNGLGPVDDEPRPRDIRCDGGCGRWAGSRRLLAGAVVRRTPPLWSPHSGARVPNVATVSREPALKTGVGPPGLGSMAPRRSDDPPNSG